MDKELEDELSSVERQALDSLRREKTPPPLLEKRVLEMLKESNLIRPARAIWWLKFSKVSIASITALVLFMLGVWAGVKWISAPSDKKGKHEFLLMLRTAPLQSPSGSTDKDLRSEYSAWAKEIRQEGLLLEGEELKPETRVLRVIDNRISAFVERVELREDDIAGYFLIVAKDYDQAITIAKSCPHLKYGGSIEVRQIEGL